MLLSPIPPIRPSSRALIIVVQLAVEQLAVDFAPGALGSAPHVYAEVDGGKSVGAQRAQVLLDALAEAGRAAVRR